MRESRKTKSTTKQQITMKKREFFKRLLGITAAAVVAPKALLAEEETLPVDKASVKSYVSSIDFIDQREVVMGDSIYRGYVAVQEVVYHELPQSCFIAYGNKIRTGDVISIDGGLSRVQNVITYANKNHETMGVSQRITVRSIKNKPIYIRKGDYLLVEFSSYKEK